MKKLIILIFPLLVLSGCMDWLSDEPTLPKVTTKGANTFGCKIDGKVFIPHRDGGLMGSNQSVFQRFAFYLKDPSKKYISIGIANDEWGRSNRHCKSTWVDMSFPVDEDYNLLGTASISFSECKKEEDLVPNDMGTTYYSADLTNDPNEQNYFEVINYKRVMGEFYEEFYFTCKFRAIAYNDVGEMRVIKSGRFDMRIDRSLKGG